MVEKLKAAVDAKNASIPMEGAGDSPSDLESAELEVA